jgi:hypothetical protein
MQEMFRAMLSYEREVSLSTRARSMILPHPVEPVQCKNASKRNVAGSLLAPSSLGIVICRGARLLRASKRRSPYYYRRGLKSSSVAIGFIPREFIVMSEFALCRA